MPQVRAHLPELAQIAAGPHARSVLPELAFEVGFVVHLVLDLIVVFLLLVLVLQVIVLDLVVVRVVGIGRMNGGAQSWRSSDFWRPACLPGDPKRVYAAAVSLPSGRSNFLSSYATLVDGTVHVDGVAVR